MKTLLIIQFLVQLLVPDFFVSHVEGNAFYKKDNQPVRIGDHLLPGEQYQFKSSKDFISVMGPKGEIYHFGPGAKLKKAVKTGIWTFIVSELVPVRKQKILATRGDASASLGQIRNYFEALLNPAQNPDNMPYVIIGEQYLSLLSTAFENREKSFFYLRYNQQEKQVNRKINYVESQDLIGDLYLLLDKSVFQVNGKAIGSGEQPLMAKLMYFDHSLNGSDSIRTINFRYVAQKPVLDELCLIRSRIRKEDLEQAIYNHIRDVYGVIDENKFKQLITTITTKQK